VSPRTFSKEEEASGDGDDELKLHGFKSALP
jgi:hypothetical protein